MQMIKNALSLLARLYPSDCTLEPTRYVGNLPLWLKHASQYYKVRVSKDLTLGMVVPKENTSYQMLVKILRQAEKELQVPTLIIADAMPPKYRSLFVRNNVPFIFKGDSIFAPALGVKLMDAKENNANLIRSKEIDSQLSAFELKLIAGYLTEFIELESFNLDQLLSVLSKNKYTCSKSKLSMTTKALVERGLLTVKDRGPLRKLKFENKTVLWKYLLRSRVVPHSQTLECHIKWDNLPPIFCGESGLAKFSSLSSPDTTTIALTRSQYQKLIKENKQNKSPTEQPTQFEIRKEDPKLFAITGCLNPIELFLELRHHPDERIQIALDEMLKMHDLTVSGHE